ncbi:unnamed protein product [Somion occarium]|uniref:Uncharacterized protein n=1 Tax=Somion occarium TaxID=3059160 RepID=A0ABP1E5E3_9APHY
MHAVWQYYRTLKDAEGHLVKYKNDRTHNATWCLACFNRKVESIEMSERNRYLLDPLTVVRDRKAIESDVYSSVNPVAGKIDDLLHHLSECEKANPTIQAWAHRELNLRKGKENWAPTAPYSILDTISGTPIVLGNTPKRPRLSGSFDDLDVSTVHNGQPFPPNLQKEFNADVCEVFIANGWAWNGAANPVWMNFIQKWIPSAERPSPYTLSGPVLNGKVAEIEE